MTWNAWWIKVATVAAFWKWFVVCFLEVGIYTVLQTGIPLQIVEKSDKSGIRSCPCAAIERRRAYLLPAKGGFQWKEYQVLSGCCWGLHVFCFSQWEIRFRKYSNIRSFPPLRASSVYLALSSVWLYVSMAFSKKTIPIKQEQVKHGKYAQPFRRLPLRNGFLHIKARKHDLTFFIKYSTMHSWVNWAIAGARERPWGKSEHHTAG